MTSKKKTYDLLMGELSATLVFPIELARHCGFDKSVTVVIEERDDGILIKKLEI